MLKVFVFTTADSLMHRVAVAEMLYLLEPNKKSEAVKLIEESSNNRLLMSYILLYYGLNDVCYHECYDYNYYDFIDLFMFSLK